MIQHTWHDRDSIKQVICVHTNAKKYVVNQVLTVGQTYAVKNETEEFYFILDNSGKVGGYYKEYFKDA